MLAVNTVPDSCTIQVDRRLLPGETREGVYLEFEELLAELKREDADFHAVMESPMLEDPALETSEESLVVAAARQAYQRVLGKARLAGVPFGPTRAS